MNVPHYLQDIQALIKTRSQNSLWLVSYFFYAIMRYCNTDLLQSLARQVRLCHCKSITLCSKVSHLTIGGPVMQCNGG